MKRKRKYESGAATAFITRNQALRKLQLSLKDFRQLCILKGIYPQEPKKLKQATKGSGITRTFYFVKDINYLSHEPLIVKFRQTKRFMKRLTKAIHKKNDDAVARIKASRPKYKLDHIVKERYPSFIDAVRDLDDCLTMCFLFATLPTSFTVKTRSVQLCRRLTVEFQHFVITSQALRKVFISIKGIYYQAEIMGQTITWIVPHKVGYQQPSDIDFKIMRTFVDFYTTLLGFTNFRLYHSLNLHYPPQLHLTGGEKDETETKCLKSEATEEKLAAMTQTLKSMVTDNVEDAEVDEFPVGNPDDPDFIEKAKLESEKLNQFQNLFKGKKFFLNREIPRESVTFIIRSFGGEVSWDKSLAVGATYQESDESITHQIVDRPTVEKQFLSRYYIQPQWIFDCVNSQMLIPVEDYFPGVELPPHLSPFVKEKEGDYVPAERKQQMRRQQGIDSGVEEDDGLMDEDDDDDEDDEEEEAIEDDDDEEEEDEDEEEESDENSDDEEEEMPKKSKKVVKKPVKTPKPAKKPKDMAVTPGSVEKVNLNRKVQQQEKEEKRLAEMMIPKKKKRLYQTIIKSQTRRDTKIQQLKDKRKVINRRNKLAKAGGE